MKVYSTMDFGVTHLNEVQGSVEERIEMYKQGHRVSTVNADAAIRQEHWWSFWLRQKTGQCDE